MFETESSRSLTTIGFLLIILGAALLFFNQSNYMQALRTQAKEVTSYSQSAQMEEEQAATEPSGNKEEKSKPLQTMEDIYEDLGISKVVQYYFKFTDYMEGLENRIQDFDNLFLVILALLGLFAVKSFIPFVPVSLTCFLSGVVLPFWLAMIVNFLGLALIFAIKYFWGRSRPSNYIHRTMKRFPTIESIVEGDDMGSTHGNPILLFALRMVPSIPINTISQLYGYMEFDFWRYMLLSMLGFSVKLIVYTVIGSNVYDPFQSAFMLPFAIILIVSGTATIGLGWFLSQRKKKSKKKKAAEQKISPVTQEKEIKPEEPDEI